MSRRKSEEHVDMSDRLRQLELLLAPRAVAPRSPADDAIGRPAPPLLDVEKHMGRMYVAGHEPHFRPVTLLAPARQRQGGLDAT